MRRSIVSAGLAAALIVAGGAGIAAAGEALSGAFTGASGHTASGSVLLVRTDAGYEIHLQKDFDFDGGPDARVGFGKGGKFVDGTDFEPLRANNGAQVYKAPAALDASGFDTVVIWCRQYTVPLAVAPLD